MAFPEKQVGVSPHIGQSEWLVRDCLEAMRERGIESAAIPEELRAIARGTRDIRTALKSASSK